MLENHPIEAFKVESIILIFYFMDEYIIVKWVLHPF